MSTSKSLRSLVLGALAFASVSQQAARADTYTQDFSGFVDGTTDLGDGSVLIGNAAVTPQVIGEQLRLTQATNDNNAAFHIPARTTSPVNATVVAFSLP